MRNVVLTPEEEKLALEILEFCVEPRAAETITAHFTALGRDIEAVRRLIYKLKYPRRELLQKLVGTSRNAVYGTTKLGLTMLKRAKTGYQIA
jgi:hypothetical protein